MRELERDIEEAARAKRMPWSRRKAANGHGGHLSHGTLVRNQGNSLGVMKPTESVFPKLISVHKLELYYPRDLLFFEARKGVHRRQRRERFERPFAHWDNT